MNIILKKLKKFLNICFKNKLNKVIFSSTASIYGDPQKEKVDENDLANPLNPYATSKLKLKTL